MISAITNNLQRGVKLLNAISENQYIDKSVAPYYSSIGVHMRHILDIFDCVLSGLESKQIDLSSRKRNELVEIKLNMGLAYFDEIIVQLEDLKEENFDILVQVKDDLGLGFITANYTLASILIQAHSHAIHHFASIGYIIAQLNINLPDIDFGYNPTTPRNIKMEN